MIGRITMSNNFRSIAGCNLNFLLIYNCLLFLLVISKSRERPRLICNQVSDNQIEDAFGFADLSKHFVIN